MNWWIKLGCKLTGWNPTLLAQCSEASRSQLSKYTSALMILMTIWSVTGFCSLNGIWNYLCGDV